MKDCCKNKEQEDKGEKGGKKGFLQGVIFGLVPHSFCIAFIVFTVIGSTLATSLLKRVLLTPYFFQILVGLSFVFATISAVIYLRRKDQLSVRGVRGNWGYLGILYGTTIAVNLLFFLVVFPAVANIGTKKTKVIGDVGVLGSLSKVTLEVKIPCSGHAPLIIDELKKDEGVINVKFILPNLFEVNYDPLKTNFGRILQKEIFKSYPATVK